MKKFLVLIISLVILDFIFQGCANPSSPTGGPKDTIPPLLLESYPLNGATNFVEQEIRFEFSEFINADKIKQQLIITPKTDVKYKSIVKKNKLIIKFEEPFSDSTTYNLNFANSVTDITENNPAVNLSLAFSTGAYIDSMSVKGNVLDLMSQENAEGYLVALYPMSDTLDFFSDFPVYFTTTNDSGKFELNYLKTGKYKIISFFDENKNVLLDPETEQHGFLRDTIQLDSQTVLSRPIQTILQNVKPITFISARPAGPYVEAKYSKQIDSYSIFPDSLLHNLIGEKKDAIRIYKPEYIDLNDSIEIILKANDSLNNSTTDSAKVVFLQSNRKPNTLSFKLSSSTKHLVSNQQISVQFNKPMFMSDSAKLYFGKDSTFSYPINPTIKWNQNNTTLTILTNVNADSLILNMEEAYKPDSANVDTTEAVADDLKSLSPRTQNPTSVDFIVESNSFISVEKDTTSKKILSLSLKQPTSFGSIKFTLNTQETAFNLQLLDNNNQVKYENKNQTEFTFPQISAGNYNIRVLIDNDQDGSWSVGNLLLNKEPEQIYVHPEAVSVRENWVIEIDLTF